MNTATLNTNNAIAACSELPLGFMEDVTGAKTVDLLAQATVPITESVVIDGEIWDTNTGEMVGLVDGPGFDGRPYLLPDAQRHLAIIHDCQSSIETLDAKMAGIAGRVAAIVKRHESRRSYYERMFGAHMMRLLGEHVLEATQVADVAPAAPLTPATELERTLSTLTNVDTDVRRLETRIDLMRRLFDTWMAPLHQELVDAVGLRDAIERETAQGIGAEAKAALGTGKRKSIDTPFGSVSFRGGTDKVEVVADKEDEAVKWAKANYPTLVKTKESILVSQIDKELRPLLPGELFKLIEASETMTVKTALGEHKFAEAVWRPRVIDAPADGAEGK